MATKGNRNELITRREAILRVSAMLGGAALVGQSAMLAGCDKPRSPAAPGGSAAPDVFSDEDVALLDEIAETILPETSTPGAKAAGVGPFMAMMVVDTYHANEQRIFREGLHAIDRRCDEMHGAAFMAATPDQRLALLKVLDAEQLRHMHAIRDQDDSPAHYFRMLKELALLGYFTSEIGYTQAMRYAETPGRFDPCVPHEQGEKAWAPHA